MAPTESDASEPADAVSAGGSGGADVAKVQRREHRIARAFVELADTLTDEFDLAEFLHLLVEHCADLLDVGAAGVLLADQQGSVRMAAASSEKAELLELFAADTRAGPCVDCIRTGRPVISTDLAADTGRWPRFVAAAELCGFSSAHVVPMRLRRQVIGALSLLSAHVDGVRTVSADLGQAMADVATIGILQQRAIGDAAVLTEQLQTALNTRVIIEQAKGVIAAHSGTLSPEEAFAALRGYARAEHRRLSDLAHDVVRDAAHVPAIVAHQARKR